MTFDKNITIEEEFVPLVCYRHLLKHSMTIASAESMTGGLFAKTFTDMQGSSRVFDRGLVTYSERAKMQELGVRAETLAEHGAVSEETAAEMAEGLKRVSGCDVCVSVTGYASASADEDYPVGLYYIGIVYRDEKAVYEFRSERYTRTEIRDEACSNMFRVIVSFVQNELDKNVK